MLYLGSCNVSKERFRALLDLAEDLGVQGLELEEHLQDQEMSKLDQKELILNEDESSYKDSIGKSTNIGDYKVYGTLSNDTKIGDTETKTQRIEIVFEKEEGQIKNSEMVKVENNSEGVGVVKLNEFCNKGKQNIETDKSLAILVVSKKTKRFYKKSNLPKIEKPASDENGQFLCTQCDYKSRNSTELKRHKLITHEGFRFNCGKCPKEFRRESRLYVHEKSFHDGFLFKCLLCSYSYNEKRMLEKHSLLQVKCKKCEYISCKRAVRKHSSKIHNPLYSDGAFKCNICSYCSLKWSRLYHHLKHTHGGRSFFCDQCTFKTQNCSDIRLHKEEKHLGITYKCQHCDYRTGRSKRLTLHVQVKHDQVQFRCKTCDLQFATPSKLRTHKINTHNKTEHPCTQCDMHYNSLDALRRHDKIKHKGKKFPCEECDFVGNGHEPLNSHRKIKHLGVFFQCSKCNFTTGYKYSLESHNLSIHEGITFDCDKCGKTFNFKHRLYKHLKKSCDSDGKSTSEKVSIHSCDKCDRKFKTKQGLNIHSAITSCKSVTKEDTQTNNLIIKKHGSCNSEVCCKEKPL